MSKNKIVFFTVILSLFCIRLNVNADVSEFDYECKFLENYDNLCFYNLVDFSINGKQYGDYSEEIVKSMLSGLGYPIQLKYDSSKTLIHWTDNYNNPDALNDHYFLDNIDGSPIKKYMQPNLGTGEPANSRNTDFQYFNYISSNNIPNKCPNKIFKYEFVDYGNILGDKYYFYWYIDENDFEKPKKGFYDKESLYEYKLIRDCDVNGTDTDISDCESLIDEKLRKYIDMSFNAIHIIVPIILLCFIIYDLALSLLDGSDDKIKKAKKRIIIRLIIAITIFFVPTIVDFILDLVNSIWSTKFDTCL